MARFLLIVLLFAAAWADSAGAGPYSPPAGTAASTAIARTSPQVIGWANGYTNYLVGSDCDPVFQTPERALGPAAGDVYDIVSLGRGGQITVWFDPPITDGPGADFAVFENAVTKDFLELAYVEVSSDGSTFARLPCDSLTPSPVPSFGAVDATDIDGLAGTYLVGFGTPFDLGRLSPDPAVNRSCIRWVRLVDVVGDGTQLDSDGDPIFDPYPTVLSAGFDLEAVGVIHQAIAAALLVQSGEPVIQFPTVAHRRYQVEYSPDLTRPGTWITIGPEMTGDGQAHTVLHDHPPRAGVYRVRIRTEDQL